METKSNMLLCRGPRKTEIIILFIYMYIYMYVLTREVWIFTTFLIILALVFLFWIIKVPATDHLFQVERYGLHIMDLPRVLPVPKNLHIVGFGYLCHSI